MNLRPSPQEDIVLPSWMGKTFALLVFLIALGVVYYGVHDGIIDQNITFRTKFGKIGIGKGIAAICIGGAFAAIGVLLLRLAYLILKNSNTD